MRDTDSLWDGDSRMYGIENPAFNTSLRLAKSEVNIILFVSSDFLNY